MVAARYAFVRTQFKNDKDQGGQKVERKLIDYQSHSFRITNNVATTYIMNLTMAELYNQYEKMISNIQKKQDFSLMAPMHANLSGIKALFTHLSYEGVKTMRELCGGNGFSKYAGFGIVISGASSLVTLEGDSVVMNLQTARALLKNGRNVVVKGKKVTKHLAYINELTSLNKKLVIEGDEATFFSDTTNLVNILKQNALYSIAHCLALFGNPKYKDYSEWEKFYQTFQIDLVRMATAHSYYISSKFAHNAIHGLGVGYDKNGIVHLKRMLRIFCLNVLLNQASTLAVTHYLTPSHYATLQDLQCKEIAALRPQLLNLIESFDWDDNSLSSDIGCFDGHHV